MPQFWHHGGSAGRVGSFRPAESAGQDEPVTADTQDVPSADAPVHPGDTHAVPIDAGPTDRDHPTAVVPAVLFDDPHLEARWRARFSAVRISLPSPARDAVDRTVYLSNESGRYELYTWDVATGEKVQATDRPDGTVIGSVSADGTGLWWFDDHAGDEFGRWKAQPFGTGPDQAGEALPGVPAGYPAGLAVGETVVLAGFSDDDGTRIHLRPGDDAGEISVVYRHDEDASVGALSADDGIWVLAHSEHGDSRYPALRALSVADGSVLGELDDTPGKGLHPIGFPDIRGDQRLLVGHERRGRDELLIWDIADGSVTEIDIDLPGDLDADFYPDGTALLVIHTHAGRTTLHRYDLASGALSAVPAAAGVVSGALIRPDGSIWYRWSSAVGAGRVRTLSPDGSDTALLEPPGGLAPDSEPVTDVRVEGPGGPVHALLARPAAVGPPVEGTTNRALPTVFLVHGGPASADEDDYDAERATYLEAGFAVVQVNYRGSTGYGSAWRDALTERVGHTELADIAAVHDHLVNTGVVDAARSFIVGASWGGFLTLLALGTQPDRWAAGVAGVPVADYVASYAQEMEPLRAYDRALFGGSPEDKPDAYADSSPLTWVDRVAAPVLVLAGENDPRCPWGQVQNYLDALASHRAEYRWYGYQAGHGSMVVDERLRQVAVSVAFVRDVLARLG
jgi:dienelactone hydrolase